MIDADKVKRFWNARSRKLKEVPFESIANLEEDPALLSLKTRLEQDRVFPRLPLSKDVTLLDLGAGVGQWAFRLAPLVKKVVAVEYSQELANIGRAEALRQKAENVEFVTSAAEEYTADQAFDIVFISGLFVYLTDEQASRVAGHLPSLVKPGGLVFLRDGTSILDGRHEINDRFSTILKASYSAVYRTRGEYIALFQARGFSLVEDGQMFDEGCPLNKFSETRLWFYVFLPDAKRHA